MKLNQIILKDNIVEDTTQSILSSLLNYNKAYELLHKQLYRKGRISYVNFELTINNRPAKLIQQYNIKSPSSNAYNSTDYYDLGLNQFFVGQSPYESYKGNLKDGIYHDTCIIVPKILEDNKAKEYITEYDIWGWSIFLYAIDSDQGIPIRINVNEYDKYSNHLVDDVRLENINNIYTIKSYLNNSLVNTIYTFPTNVNINSYSISIQKINLSNPQYCPKRAVFDLSSFGDIIYREQGVGSFLDTLSSIFILSSGYKDVFYAYSHPDYVESVGYDSEVIVFRDGTAVQITYPSIAADSSDGSSSFYYVPATIAFLPLVYTDTGDLVQNKFDFIDNWENQFRLIVREDKDHFTRFFIVAAFTIIGFFTGGILGMVGGFLVGVGTVNNNSNLKIVGGLLTLGGSISIAITDSITESLVAEGVSEAAAQTAAEDILIDMSASEIFNAYTSTIGFSKALNIAGTLFNTYTTLTTNQSVPKNTETTKEKRTLGIIEDDKSSGHSYINKIMNIGKIDIK